MEQPEHITVYRKYNDSRMITDADSNYRDGVIINRTYRNITTVSSIHIAEEMIPWLVHVLSNYMKEQG